MDVQDARITESEFATCLRHMPQPCVDLVVAYDGGLLLARRQNEPAKGRLFWPGGRLYKGERLDDAPTRIAREELGLNVRIDERLGVSEHFWDHSSVEGVESRHTIPVVYRVVPEPADQPVELDAQHSEYEVLRRPRADLHEYVREYVERFDLLQ
jgi:colanic acid biosynthesis protein WcaH